MSRRSAVTQKIERREVVTAAEVLTEAAVWGVAVLEQGRARDRQQIAADLARAMGRAVVLEG